MLCRADRLFAGSKIHAYMLRIVLAAAAGLQIGAGLALWSVAAKVTTGPGISKKVKHIIGK